MSNNFLSRLFKKGPTIEQAAQATGKALLSSVLEMKNRGGFSLESIEDKRAFYNQVLHLRLGYNQPAIDQVIERAELVSSERGFTDGINFNVFVLMVVMREYALDTGKTITDDDIRKMQKAIRQLTDKNA